MDYCPCSSLAHRPFPRGRDFPEQTSQSLDSLSLGWSPLEVLPEHVFPSAHFSCGLLLSHCHHRSSLSRRSEISPCGPHLSHSFWLCLLVPPTGLGGIPGFSSLLINSVVGRQSLVSAPVRLHSFHFCTDTFDLLEVCAGGLCEIKKLPRKRPTDTPFSLPGFLLCLKFDGLSSVPAVFNSYTSYRRFNTSKDLYSLPWTFLSELSWVIQVCFSAQVYVPSSSKPELVFVGGGEYPILAGWPLCSIRFYTSCSLMQHCRARKSQSEGGSWREMWQAGTQGLSGYFLAGKEKAEKGVF